MGGGELEKEKTWPIWLNPLLQTAFFVPCKFHGDSSKNECNMFCLDCMNGALCSSCLALHCDHHAIQIRRSSYHDVIRVSEIQKLLDISGVQTYIINSAKVVFLNERPQPRPGKGATNICEVCERGLLDTFTFCSLACKLAASESSPQNHRWKSMAPQSSSESRKSSSNNRINRQKNSPPSLSGTQSEEDAIACRISPPTPPTISVNYKIVRRRKGVPHRAPMGIC